MWVPTHDFGEIWLDLEFPKLNPTDCGLFETNFPPKSLTWSTKHALTILGVLYKIWTLYHFSMLNDLFLIFAPDWLVDPEQLLIDSLLSWIRAEEMCLGDAKPENWVWGSRRLGTFLQQGHFCTCLSQFSMSVLQLLRLDLSCSDLISSTLIVEQSCLTIH